MILECLNEIIANKDLLKDKQGFEDVEDIVNTLINISFRYLADNHQNLSIEEYLKIMKQIFRLGDINRNFDDGSKLYDKTILEELKKYNEDNWNKFDNELQQLLLPHFEGKINKKDVLSYLKEKINI